MQLDRQAAAKTFLPKLFSPVLLHTETSVWGQEKRAGHFIWQVLWVERRGSQKAILRRTHSVT